MADSAIRHAIEDVGRQLAEGVGVYSGLVGWLVPSAVESASAAHNRAKDLVAVMQRAHAAAIALEIRLADREGGDHD
jgi:hypothetical protein